MKTEQAFEILKSWDSRTINQIIDLLNLNHIVSDEDCAGLSSTMIRHWADECDNYLRNAGYCGGKLQTAGKYFQNHGAIYVLYDESQISYEEASKYLNSVAEREI